MRFIITVALALMPIAVVQFFPSVSQAFVIISSPQGKQQARIIDKPQLNTIDNQLGSATFIETEAEVKREPRGKKYRRVELVQGKKNTDGMKLLSMLLMLKEKR